MYAEFLYHTLYETFALVDELYDIGFNFHAAMAKLWAILAVDIADAQVIWEKKSFIIFCWMNSCRGILKKNPFFFINLIFFLFCVFSWFILAWWNTVTSWRRDNRRCYRSMANSSPPRILQWVSISLFSPLLSFVNAKFIGIRYYCYNNVVFLLYIVQVKFSTGYHKSYFFYSHWGVHGFCLLYFG